MLYNPITTALLFNLKMIEKFKRFEDINYERLEQMGYEPLGLAAAQIESLTADILHDLLDAGHEEKLFHFFFQIYQHGPLDDGQEHSWALWHLGSSCGTYSLHLMSDLSDRGHFWHYPEGFLVHVFDDRYPEFKPLTAMDERPNRVGQKYREKWQQFSPVMASSIDYINGKLNHLRESENVSQGKVWQPLSPKQPVAKQILNSEFEGV